MREREREEKQRQKEILRKITKYNKRYSNKGRLRTKSQKDKQTDTTLENQGWQLLDCYLLSWRACVLLLYKSK